MHLDIEFAETCDEISAIDERHANEPRVERRVTLHVDAPGDAAVPVRRWYETAKERFNVLAMVEIWLDDSRSTLAAASEFHDLNQTLTAAAGLPAAQARILRAMGPHDVTALLFAPTIGDLLHAIERMRRVADAPTGVTLIASSSSVVGRVAVDAMGATRTMTDLSLASAEQRAGMAESALPTVHVRAPAVTRSEIVAVIDPVVGSSTQVTMIAGGLDYVLSWNPGHDATANPHRWADEVVRLLWDAPGLNVARLMTHWSVEPEDLGPVETPTARADMPAGFELLDEWGSLRSRLTLPLNTLEVLDRIVAMLGSLSITRRARPTVIRTAEFVRRLVHVIETNPAFDPQSESYRSHVNAVDELIEQVHAALVDHSFCTVPTMHPEPAARARARGIEAMEGLVSLLDRILRDYPDAAGVVAHQLASPVSSVRTTTAMDDGAHPFFLLEGPHHTWTSDSEFCAWVHDIFHAGEREALNGEKWVLAFAEDMAVAAYRAFEAPMRELLGRKFKLPPRPERHLLAKSILLRCSVPRPAIRFVSTEAFGIELDITAALGPRELESITRDMRALFRSGVRLGQWMEVAAPQLRRQLGDERDKLYGASVEVAAELRHRRREINLLCSEVRADAIASAVIGWPAYREQLAREGRLDHTFVQRKQINRYLLRHGESGDLWGLNRAARYEYREARRWAERSQACRHASRLVALLQAESVDLDAVAWHLMSFVDRGVTGVTLPEFGTPP